MRRLEVYYSQAEAGARHPDGPLAITYDEPLPMQARARGTPALRGACAACARCLRAPHARAPLAAGRLQQRRSAGSHPPSEPLTAAEH